MGRDSEADVRFGLVGCGAVSTQHVEAMHAVAGARLVAVTSRVADQARACGERWAVAWEPSYDDLLSRADIDAVAICTPSGLHAAQALAALRHGKHVLVEKPLSLSVADANRVIREGQRQGRIVATVFQMRFEPIMQALNRAVTSGAFGRVSLVIGEGLYYRPQSYYDSAPWRGTRDLDGGVLMNQAIHLIDLMCWLGGPVLSVAAHVSTLGHQMEAEDTAAVSIRFASGALGEIVATTCTEPEAPQILRIYGDRGHVRIVGEEPVEWDLPGVARPEAIADTQAEAGVSGTATWGTTALGHVRQYRDFVEAIHEGRPPSITGEDGRESVGVVAGAYQSDQKGRTVMVQGALTSGLRRSTQPVTQG
jgi:UDP-N-acetyl-2-amino-2-deoxyglucuronate dehydrogenase